MNEFEFETDDEFAAFCWLIVREMERLFQISDVGAVGRINRDWRGLDLECPEMVYHETAEYWAKSIYYGFNCDWWLNSIDLKPRPYP